MLKYFQTTTLILLWCFVLSLLWGGAVYWWTARQRARRETPEGGRLVILPALVLGPLALAGAFRAFEINLLFPLHFFADVWTLLWASFIPALVLMMASGVPFVLSEAIRREYAHWQGRSFAVVALAMGRRKPEVLRRLVLVKSLTGTWTQCLPWLFGELIIVETVFNAPGLGLDAWHLARTRDLAGLGEVVFWLALLYGAAVALSAGVNRWIGRRLESYA